MGQCFATPAVDECYLAPAVLQGLEKIDLNKLKKLIQKGHLAPCYEGRDEGSDEVSNRSATCRGQTSTLTSSCCVVGRMSHMLPPLPGPEHVGLLHTAHLHGMHPQGACSRTPTPCATRRGHQCI
jgi:hypothetical protein